MGKMIITCWLRVLINSINVWIDISLKINKKSEGVMWYIRHQSFPTKWLPIDLPFWNSSTLGYQKNKSNGVRTIDAFSRVLVLLYRAFICSFVLLLLKSSVDSHTFLFQTFIYRNFGQKRRFCSISTRLWWTDGRTYATDGHTLL